MTKPYVVGVSGSRRDGSHTLKTVRGVLQAAESAGARTDCIDLGNVDLPLYHPDRDDQGESARLTAMVADADAVVLGSPVYHGSYSSAFRNFHDYCGSDEYEDTAVALVAVAGGSTYTATLDHMRSTVRGVHGDVIPDQLGVPNASSKFEDGALVDDSLAERVTSLADALVDRARLFRRRVGFADRSHSKNPVPASEQVAHDRRPGERGTRECSE